MSVGALIPPIPGVLPCMQAFIDNATDIGLNILLNRIENINRIAGNVVAFAQALNDEIDKKQQQINDLLNCILSLNTLIGEMDVSLNSVQCVQISGYLEIMKDEKAKLQAKLDEANAALDSLQNKLSFMIDIGAEAVACTTATRTDRASLTSGSFIDDNELRWSSVIKGPEGDFTSVRVITSTPFSPLSITVTGREIEVTLEGDSFGNTLTSAADLSVAMAASFAASEIVIVDLVSSPGAGDVFAFPKTFLTGGGSTILEEVSLRASLDPTCLPDLVDNASAVFSL